MDRSRVRCWELEPGVFVTYPEDNQGHGLISCLRCGQIYAVNIARSVYLGPPLAQKIEEEQQACVLCNSPLHGNWAQYPDKYRRPDGRIAKYQRPSRIPNDSDSQVRDFPEIYSD